MQPGQMAEMQGSIQILSPLISVTDTAGKEQQILAVVRLPNNATPGDWETSLAFIELSTLSIKRKLPIP